MTKNAYIGIGTIIIALTALYVIFCSNLLNPPESYRCTIHVYWHNTLGIRTGTTIYMKGINIGKVKEISFSNERQMARVTIDLYYFNIIPENSNFYIQSGFIGDRWISVNPGNSRNFLSENSEVDGIDPLSMGDSLTAFNNRMDSTISNIDYVQKQAEKINDIVSKEQFRNGIKEKVINIRNGTKLFNKTIVDADKHLDIFSDSVQKGLLTMSVELALAAKGIRGNIAAIMQNASNSVNTLNRKVILQGNEIAAIINQLKESSANLLSAVEHISETVDPNTGIPPKIKTTLLSLRQACLFIEEGTQEILAFSEKSSVYQNDIKDIMGNVNKALNRIDGTLNSVLGYVREEEKPKFKYKKSFEVIITGSDNTMNADLSGSMYFANDKFVNLGVMDINKDYAKVNLQVGQVINQKITVRGGMIKSSFGGGFDYNIKDNLSLSADIFDFTKSKAKFDVKSRYLLHENFELVLGVDDLLDTKKVKLGFGLRF